MTAAVPVLGTQLFVTNPESIIGYTLNRFFNTPKLAIPFLDGEIISLPHLVSLFGGDADTLCNNIGTDLSRVLNRIFDGERSVNVTVTPMMRNPIDYDVTISIIYTVNGGEPKQTGTSITLKDGKLLIPEFDMNNFLSN